MTIKEAYKATLNGYKKYWKLFLLPIMFYFVGNIILDAIKTGFRSTYLIGVFNLFKLYFTNETIATGDIIYTLIYYLFYIIIFPLFVYLPIIFYAHQEIWGENRRFKTLQEARKSCGLWMIIMSLTFLANEFAGILFTLGEYVRSNLSIEKFWFYIITIVVAVICFGLLLIPFFANFAEVSILHTGKNAISAYIQTVRLYFSHLWLNTVRVISLQFPFKILSILIYAIVSNGNTKGGAHLINAILLPIFTLQYCCQLYMMLKDKGKEEQLS